MEVLGILVLILAANSALSQENAGMNISPSLEECYNNTFMVTRDNRLPATINTLIALIREAEEGNPNIDARQLSIQLLHRFRQDGLRKSTKVVGDSVALPYAPSDKEMYLYQLQLKLLTPGNAVTFNNDSLTALERCSLHSMISSSIEINKRGDEDTVCSRLSRYTSRLRKRQTELTDTSDAKGIFSECPLESGVVDTKWGAVKGGLVLGGIAAGFNLMGIITKNGTLDNRYGSTIAGQLAQAAVYALSTDIAIGGKGYWNSSALPKYHFLSNLADKRAAFVTDAEIRGGLDGLYLARGLEKWKSTFPDLKISQILDLYYSSRGVFNKDIRACNRKILETNQTTTQNLIDETTRYSIKLNEIAVTQVSHNVMTLYNQSVNSVNKFNDYLASMNDVDCSNEDDVVERIASDIVIFLDSNWEFDDIYPLISRILDNIDINKFESSYTILSGNTGEIVVNKTRTLLDFHTNYNRTVHEKLSSGLDYEKALRTAEGFFRTKLDNSTDLTGQGTVIILFPHSAPSSSESSYARNLRDTTWKSNLPDLKVLIVTQNSRDNFASFVTNTNTDVIAFQDNAGEDILKEAAKSVVSRLKKLPRNIVNPNCGSSFNAAQDSTFEVLQFVEPTGINYHKVAPNYFYSGKEGRKLKVKSYGYGDLTVCMSRTDPNPGNGTTAGDACKVITGSNEASYDLSCSGDSVTACSPIYLSIQGGVSTQTRCNDVGCRFPDNIKYAVVLENVQCVSGSQQLVSSLGLILFVLGVISKML